jgi:NADH/NAD ratio-sensing transcriptional regulator Rex
MLKVENLEMETKSIRFLISTNQSELTGLTTVLVKIERLISKLIDDDGDIIHSAELRKLEIDIAEIKKDISYIRDSNK